MQADVLVVGSGASGCAAARGLVDAGLRVTLLEAGGHDRHLFVTAPAAFSRLFRTGRDWAFYTEPQPGLDGRRLYWPRGRVLGGSSSINATIWIRGAKEDYDAWGPGWTWDEVRPTFRAIETYSGGASETRGGDGPVPVGPRAASHELAHAFVTSAAEALQVPEVASFNDGTLDGAGLYESNHRRGERWSAYRAFVKPMVGNPHLSILSHVRVLKVLVEGGRAVGVRALVDGRLTDLRAGGVVLAAGAVQTPQLLMLSGLGPRAELSRHNIGVVRDLPGVGEGLQDHLAVPMIFASRLPSLNPRLNELAAVPWLLNRTGPLASNVAEAGAFVRTEPGLTLPDIQYHFGPLYFRDHGFTKARGEFFSIGPTLVEVHSRGRIGLSSADPLAPPRIDPGSLTDERDLESLVRGCVLAREVARTGELGVANAGEVFPRDPDLVGHVRREAATLYHPAGSCALGDGDEAPLTRELALKGVTGLWVADASVMPRLIHANTQAASMMIGARAAGWVAGGI